MPELPGIYCIHNSINGYRYIGSSYWPNARIKQHIALLQKGQHYNQQNAYRPLNTQTSTREKHVYIKAHKILPVEYTIATLEYYPYQIMLTYVIQALQQSE